MIQTRLLTSNDEDVNKDLSALSSAHSEAVEDVKKRGALIADRIRAWEEFRRKEDKLFAWLRQMEREKLSLNLKHVQVRRIADVLQRIEVSLFCVFIFVNCPL